MSLRWGVLLLGACTATDPETADTEVPSLVPTFAEDIAPKMVACTGCHGGQTPDGGLDLRTDTYNALLGASAQADLALVSPGDYLASYVWHKLNGSQVLAGGAGTRMPLGQAWSDADIELVAAWIDLGAAP